MVVSQRPSELDSTVLSQCGTLFALRMANSHDRGHVTGTVSDNFGGFLDALALLAHRVRRLSSVRRCICPCG